MANPIAVAVRGKGMLPMLQRGVVLFDRYGLDGSKMAGELLEMTALLAAYGWRATLPVTAAPLARSAELARRLQAQGVELAIHGFKHVDHTRLPLEALVASVQKAAQVFYAAGVRAAGFRSPYLRWNSDTLGALRSCGFAYDASQAVALDVTAGLETGRYQRGLEFYEAQSARRIPSLPRLQGGLALIPYNLPDDEALVERLQLPPGAMIDVWTAMLEETHRQGELLALGLHPERFSLCREALEAVLKRAATLFPAVWPAQLNEIAAWQNALSRASFTLVQAGPRRYHIGVRAPARAAVLARGVELEAPAEAWGPRWQRLADCGFAFRCCTRPVVGIAPYTPPELAAFLHDQGILFEAGDPEDYPFYLSCKTFTRQDERPLLAEIENGDWPLVRIGRWPGGARCALAVTGDVDAFTIWDYTHRLNGG